MTSAFAEWVKKYGIIQANYWRYPQHIPEGTLYDGVMGTVGDGWVSILDALARRLIACESVTIALGRRFRLARKSSNRFRSLTSPARALPKSIR